MVNQTVSHYLILEKLGDGGMGVVYRAEDLRLGREVALKFLPEDLTRDRAAAERFEREARTAAAITHPNICTIYEIDEFQGTPFLAMELLEGETVKDKIKRRPVPMDALLDWAIQITSGLEVAHNRGILHRDLKPANLFITTAGQAKILDFGLAKLRMERRSAPAAEKTITALQTDPGTMMGTPAYMSPEQACGEEVDARSDIFSLGVVLYEMATGELPFQGPSPAVVIASLLRDSPKPPSELNPELPEQMERIIIKALDKERSNRFQTASDLRTDLKRIAREFGLGQLTTTIPAAPSHTRPVAMRGMGWLIPTVALVVVAALTSFLTTRSKPVPRIVRTTQITSDRQAKVVPFLTDGSRVYFNTGSYIASQPYEASIRGGDSVPMTIGVTNPTLLDISWDGLDLLVGSDEGPSSGQSPLELDELSLWIYPVVGGAARRLGNLLVSDAAISPDGQWLAYTKGSDIGIARSDGTASRKLATVRGGAPYFPRWSPEGKRIRFTLGRASSLASKYAGTQLAGTSLWEIASNGNHLQRVFPNSEDAQCCGNWTRDGRYFVFQTTNSDVSTISAIRDKVTVFEREQTPVQLTFGPMNIYGPVPSPNNKRLFVGGRQPRIEIVRYDIESKSFAPYLRGISAEGLDFSRDGKWVAYVSYPEGILWRSTVNGQKRLQLSNGPMSASLPRWSPDGKRIAFLGRDPGKPEKIFMIRADGGAVQELATTENAGDPTWGPDGNSIAFSRGVFDPGRSSTRIAVQLLNLTTQEVSTIPGSEGLWSPRWSPDGRYIAALSSDTRKLLVFDRHAGQWNELARAEFGYPSWSTDSEYIYFDTLDKNSAFCRVRVRDHKTERIVSLTELPRKTGTFGPWAGVAPDGSPLVTRDASFDEIYALDWEAP